MASDLLLEIGCEELPAKLLLNLAQGLRQAVTNELNKAEISFNSIDYFATPRRLAILVKELSASQPPRTIERQGPSLDSAYDKSGSPTLSCLGFAKSCGVSVDQLETRETKKGSWVYCYVKQEGKPTRELLPELLQAAIKNLSINKSMRWGSHEVQFIRPVKWIVLLLGNAVVPAELLGKTSDRISYGHRFHHPEAFKIEEPSQYLSLLKKHKVIAGFEERRAIIRELIAAHSSPQMTALLDEDLLTEVTGLVEWPTLHIGHFDRRFLEVPAEVLICSMKTHQKTFPVVNSSKALQPYFIVISNIESKNANVIVSGNERVINARLNDAEFFYHNDLKLSLTERSPQLEKLVFQKELGSMAAKVERIAILATWLAHALQADPDSAKRAALLAKTDLLTDMVKEFPELQGIMGYYYAMHAEEDISIASAIRDQYQPRFAGDAVATSVLGSIIAIADKIDSIVGTLGINKKPTGDKDPFGLRRAAVGILRTLVENHLALDLAQLIEVAAKAYAVKLPNSAVMADSFEFIMDRYKAWCLDQHISVDIFAAVRANKPTDILDFSKRIHAVQAFLKLPEAISLAAANKRVKNILKKQTEFNINIQLDPALFELAAETELANLMISTRETALALYQANDYQGTLCSLASLKEPVDHFFDQVMIMTEDSDRRQNRLALLHSLQELFSLVADISLLQ